MNPLSIRTSLRVQVLAFLAVATTGVAQTLAIEKPFTPLRFTVGRSLQIEGIGTSVFTTDGEHLLYEHTAAYDKGNHFPHWEMGAGDKIMMAGTARPPCEWDDASGYTLGPISPDGKRFAYRRTSESGVTLGVCELSTGHKVEFSIGAEEDNGFEDLWISEAQLVFRTTAAGHLPESLEMTSERLGMLADAWHKKTQGKESTSSVVGSGRYANIDDRIITGAGLALADVRTGEVHLLAEGEFPMWTASPDGTLLAAVRQRPVPIDPGKKLSNRAWDRNGNRNDLILFDLKQRTETVVCPECSLASLSGAVWMNEGRTLVFFSYDSGGDSISLRRYDLQSGTVELLNPSDFTAIELKPPHGPYDAVRLALLGDSFVVYGRFSNANPGWYLLRKGQKPRNLTEAFGAEKVWIAAVTSNWLIAEAGGQVWSIDKEGRRERIAGERGSTVRVRLESESIFGGIYGPLRPQMDRLVLLAEASDNAHPTQVQLYDPANARIRTLASIPHGAEILAVSAAGEQTAFTTRSNGGSVTLSLAKADAVTEVAKVNRDWDRMLKGRTIRIDHKGINGESLISWLVLPVDYQPGRRVPTVVDIYPGRVYKEDFTSSFQNGDESQIWANYGYAILYVSVPMPKEIPFEPIEHLADKVLTAVDAAIAKGYTDPDRMAVQGHSFGGYGALCVITQTERFRAAIEAAGPVDLISEYGTMLPQTRFLFTGSNAGLSMMGNIENGQVGLSGPPWQDPSHYLRNSPLFFVKNITTPVMLVQGDQDFVPIQQGEEMFTALQRLGKDALFVRYWGEWHGISSPANRRDLWARRLAWYDDHLDISRNDDGDMLWNGQEVQGRHGGPTRTRDWFLELDRKLTAAKTR